MKGSARESFHTLRASFAIPLGFVVGSGVAFISCLLWEGHRLGYFDRQLTLPALYFSLWAGMSCGAIILVMKAIAFCVRDLRGK
jgi:hypothetical protein